MQSCRLPLSTDKVIKVQTNFIDNLLIVVKTKRLNHIFINSMKIKVQAQYKCTGTATIYSF